MFHYATLLKSWLEAGKINRMSREQLLELQQHKLREIVAWAYEQCPFYYDLYTKHGFKKEHIGTLKIDDLPIIDKSMLMKHFNDVVTDKKLTFNELEAYIQGNDDPAHNYMGKYKILHTSGTSGKIGIFPTSTNDVAYVLGRLLNRFAPVTFKHLFFKQKVAYFAATHGHFIGVTYLTAAPKASMKVKIFSILDPLSDIVEALNKFQPEEITGYASSMEMLAEQAEKGNLNIKPKTIVCGGDPLYQARRDKIRTAFNVEPRDTYSMTEGMGVANQLPGDDHLSIADDLYLIETKPTRITNLYNKTFPIIRYQNDDVLDLMPNPDYSKRPFTQIEQIEGRDVDFLHITNNRGEQDMLHPAPLVEFYVEGLQKIQFWRQREQKILVKAVSTPQAQISNDEIKSRIFQKMIEILKAKQAEKSMRINVLMVDDIPVDKRTGKFRLVNVEK